jgi:translation initiation factor IF-2
VGVKGNEEADEEAKKAVKEETVQIHLQYGAPEYMEKINRALKERWQNSWEKERKGRAYFTIQENVNKDRCTFRCIRKDDVAITRLRLGHCGLRSGLALIGKHPFQAKEDSVPEAWISWGISF